MASYEAAVGLYQACQRAGETVRALTDCLIGAVAARAGVPVLHDDRDFDVLARHTGVRRRVASCEPGHRVSLTGVAKNTVTTLPS